MKNSLISCEKSKILILVFSFQLKINNDKLLLFFVHILLKKIYKIKTYKKYLFYEKFFLYLVTKTNLCQIYTHKILCFQITCTVI